MTLNEHLFPDLTGDKNLSQLYVDFSVMINAIEGITSSKKYNGDIGDWSYSYIGGKAQLSNKQIIEKEGSS